MIIIIIFYICFIILSTLSIYSYNCENKRNLATFVFSSDDELISRMNFSVQLSDDKDLSSEVVDAEHVSIQDPRLRSEIVSDSTVHSKVGISRSDSRNFCSSGRIFEDASFVSLMLENWFVVV